MYIQNFENASHPIFIITHSNSQGPRNSNRAGPGEKMGGGLEPSGRRAGRKNGAWLEPSGRGRAGGGSDGGSGGGGGGGRGVLGSGGGGGGGSGRWAAAKRSEMDSDLACRARAVLG